MGSSLKMALRTAALRVAGTPAAAAQAARRSLLASPAASTTPHAVPLLYHCDAWLLPSARPLPTRPPPAGAQLLASAGDSHAAGGWRQSPLASSVSRSLTSPEAARARAPRNAPRQSPNCMDRRSWRAAARRFQRSTTALQSLRQPRARSPLHHSPHELLPERSSRAASSVHVCGRAPRPHQPERMPASPPSLRPRFARADCALV
ncbi:uncharacterized protein CC84DRAFT_1238236 [Paraphaeosphaeria sporulosa]|uniref:Uncharacterized protein n=1 Tax=Paraphaeosphaeria sporulosa TaxID=1460663 RepID=A0A177CTY9_9PLEO|nr:uncharacterized protein CC84DRAFT_1238236 [Paraphaeosphaeria sporulosa]OAG10983.1 hypothetical protein CC84DRAFT_1238236 [Paraphaeosphaeria sporulosa]